MSLKDSTCPVRESVSVDSLATGTVLRETTTDQAQQADGTPPETRQYFCNCVEFLHFVNLLQNVAFSALTLLVGQQEGHAACKKTEWWGAGMVICLGVV